MVKIKFKKYDEYGKRLSSFTMSESVVGYNRYGDIGVYNPNPDNGCSYRFVTYTPDYTAIDKNFIIAKVNYLLQSLFKLILSGKVDYVEFIYRKADETDETLVDITGLVVTDQPSLEIKAYLTKLGKVIKFPCIPLDKKDHGFCKIPKSKIKEKINYNYEICEFKIRAHAAVNFKFHRDKEKANKKSGGVIFMKRMILLDNRLFLVEQDSELIHFPSCLAAKKELEAFNSAYLKLTFSNSKDAKSVFNFFKKEFTSKECKLLLGKCAAVDIYKNKIKIDDRVMCKSKSDTDIVSMDLTQSTLGKVNIMIYNELKGKENNTRD